IRTVALTHFCRLDIRTFVRIRNRYDAVNRQGAIATMAYADTSWEPANRVAPVNTGRRQPAESPRRLAVITVDTSAPASGWMEAARMRGPTPPAPPRSAVPGSGPTR